MESNLNNQLKILHIISTMDPKYGGPSQGIRNIIPHLYREGLIDDVLCMDDPEIDYGIEDSFKIIKLGHQITSFGYNKHIIKWLSSNLADYDIVLVQGIWQYQNYAVYNVINKLKKKNIKAPKVCIMPHGMMDPYFQQSSDRKWKAIRNEIVWRITEKKALNAADAMLFTCQEELILARSTFKGYHPKKEINLGYGVEHPPSYTLEMKEEFNALCKNLNGRDYWLFLSRIHNKKGVQNLVEIHKRLSQEFPSVPDLVIAGPLESEYAKKIVSSAMDNPKIHFPGMLKGNSKWGAFYGCNAYLLPSYQENYGIAIVEAMACHKPVIITKQVNIWREIESGNGGLIMEDNRYEYLYKTLKSLITMPKEQLETLGENAYFTFLNHFYIKNTATKFIEKMKEINNE